VEDNPSRRKVMRALGAGSAATVGIPAIATAQESEDDIDEERSTATLQQMSSAEWENHKRIVAAQSDIDDDDIVREIDAILPGPQGFDIGVYVLMAPCEAEIELRFVTMTDGGGVTCDEYWVDNRIDGGHSWLDYRIEVDFDTYDVDYEYEACVYHFTDFYCSEDTGTL